MANGEHIEVAKAFVTIVPSMEGSQATITKELTGVTNEAADKAGEESGTNFGNKFASALKGTGAAIGAAMAAAAGAAVATGKAFVDAANDVSAMGDAIGDNAAKMMLDTQSYQEWDFVLQRAGSSIDSMKTAMKTLANAAVDGSDAFEALGISQEQLASMNQAELFEATVKSLQNVTDEQERMALASDLLGKGAVELGAVFSMTNEELDAQKQKMYELGAYMDEDAIAASDNYQDTMIDLQDSLKGLKISMMSDFLPGITQVMTGLAGVFSGNGGIEEIRGGLETVIGKITELAPQFLSLGQTLILSLISGFAPMLPQLVSTVFSVLVQGITTITSMIPSMMPSIIAGIEGIMMALLDAAPVIIDGLTQLIVELVTWLSTGDTITTFVNGIIQLASQITNSIALILPVLLPAIVRIISELAQALTSPENVMMILNSTLMIIGAVVMALIEAFPEIINLVVGLLGNIGETLLMFIDTASTDLAGWFAEVIPNVIAFFANIGGKIKSWFTETVSKAAQFGADLLGKFRELPSKIIEVGSNLIRGIWEGISNMGQWIKDKIAGFGETITNGFKAVFGIASPSKLFADVIGSNLALGIGEGFEDEIGNVEADMVGSMDDLTGSMTANVQAYAATGAAIAGDATTYNGGNISINVYGAEGQSETALAEIIAVKLQDMTRRQGLIYG